MRIITLDTTTDTSSIALGNEGSLLAEYNFAHHRDLSSRLMGIIKNMLADCRLTMKDIEAVGVSVGPGSFTGLRIGIVTAKSLSQALNIPIAGIPSLDLLAYQFDLLPNQLVCPMIRVRKGEAYYALFRSHSGGMQRISDYVAEPIELLINRVQETEGGRVIFCGDAVQENLPDLQKGIPDRVVPGDALHSFPKASVLARLSLEKIARGDSTDCMSLLPFYIRKSTPEIRLESDV